MTPSLHVLDKSALYGSSRGLCVGCRLCRLRRQNPHLTQNGRAAGGGKIHTSHKMDEPL